MSPAAIVYTLTFFVFGLCVGSFLNVVIFRLPHGISLIMPPSTCPGCGRQLGAMENIPVLSWLMQGRKCKGCGSKIHWRYPAVELFAGLLWALTAYIFHDMPGTHFERIATMILCFWLVSMLIAVSFIDIDLTIIPDSLNITGIVVSLVASAILPGLHPEVAGWAIENVYLKGFLGGLLGLVVGGGLMYLLSVVGTKLFKAQIEEMQKEDPDLDSAIGFGDVKLMAFLGAFLGWQGALCAFFLSTVAGSFFGILIKFLTGQPPLHEKGCLLTSLWNNLKHRWQTGESMMPYGPYLCLGALITLYFREPIVEFFGGGLAEMISGKLNG